MAKIIHYNFIYDKNNNLKYCIKEDTKVVGGAFYMYNTKMLSSMLRKSSGILKKLLIITDPITQREAYIFVEKVFNDLRFR